MRRETLGRMCGPFLFREGLGEGGVVRHAISKNDRVLGLWRLGDNADASPRDALSSADERTCHDALVSLSACSKFRRLFVGAGEDFFGG